MTLTTTQRSLLTYTLLGVFIFVCFRAGLDNFFSGDDFDWLFLSLKAMHHPSYFITSQGYFLRYTEAAYFIGNFLIAGFEPMLYQFTAIGIHVLNVLLFCYLANLICKNRLSGLLAAIFWGVNYKHVEAVFRLYGVADSLALLFGLGAFLLFLHKRPMLAALSLFIGVFGKENAVLFPLVISTYVVLCMPGKRSAWLKRTIPMWVVALCIGFLGWYIRSKSSPYLSIDTDALIRFWELAFTYIGPDAVYLKQVWLSGAPFLFPFWLAILLFLPFGIIVWKAPNLYRFGLAWIVITTLPTVFVGFQTSRYYYIPLVGLGLLVGHGTSQLLTHFQKKRVQLAFTLVGLGFMFLIIYYIVGINLEEQDYDYFGRFHRQAAESFKTHVLPTLLRNQDAMAIFPKQSSQKWAEESYAQVLSKPWHAPFTFKWVYPRPYAILGLTNTYAFVSYCAYGEDHDTLFVKVPFEDFQNRLRQGPIVVVTYDDQTNTFTIEEDSSKVKGFQHLDTDDAYRMLQPGYFDPTNLGSPYL